MAQSLWESRYEEEAVTKLFFFNLMNLLSSRDHCNLITPPHQQNIDLNKLYDKSQHTVFHEDYLYIPIVNLSISKQCTLKCRDCAALSPYYKSKPMNLAEVYTWFFKMIEAVDFIDRLEIIGGEPLLQKRLPDLLRMILEHKKVGRVKILSNGTLYPSPELIDVIASDSRVELAFSRYDPKIVPKFNEVVSFCRKNGINPLIRDYSKNPWVNYFQSNLEKKKEINLEEVFNLCSGSKCRDIWNGRLYFCSLPQALDNLDLLKSKDSEFVDLINTTIDERRAKISKLYRGSVFPTCLGCARAYNSPKVPAAVQTKKPDLEKLRIDFKQQLAVLGID